MLASSTSQRALRQPWNILNWTVSKYKASSSGQHTATRSPIFKFGFFATHKVMLKVEVSLGQYRWCTNRRREKWACQGSSRVYIVSLELVTYFAHKGSIHVMVLQMEYSHSPWIWIDGKDGSWGAHFSSLIMWWRMKTSSKWSDAIGVRDNNLEHSINASLHQAGRSLSFKGLL